MSIVDEPGWFYCLLSLTYGLPPPMSYPHSCKIFTGGLGVVPLLTSINNDDDREIPRKMLLLNSVVLVVLMST